eukprot:scaffold18141_cov48-Phaeocystis_antarctica.AAC.3
MSLYQIRLNVRYTTGRSASLLLAPVVGSEAHVHMRHWPGQCGPKRPMGRGWPELGAARGMIWR